MKTTALLIFLLTLSLPVSAAESVSARDYAAAHQAAQQLPRLHSLLVSQGDELVFEEYYNDRDPKRPANMKSASKSVISALVGIAIDQGLIKSVDVKIADYFPELISASQIGRAHV